MGSGARPRFAGGPAIGDGEALERKLRRWLWLDTSRGADALACYLDWTLPGWTPGSAELRAVARRRAMMRGLS